MNKWLLAFVILLLLAIAGVGAAYYVGSQGLTISRRADVGDPQVVISEEPEQLVGDDVDEYGCIASAGPTWCGTKQKCLREWEEPCDELAPQEDNAEDQMRALFASKYSKPVSDVNLEISQNTGTHATGLVRFAGEISGAMWLAHKEGSAWVLDFDGQGTIPCESVQPHGYPASMVTECWDDASGTLINL